MNEHLPGTRIAEQLMTRPGGASMDEIIAATGGPQYNVLRRLEARGYHVRKVREGRVTRYFAEPPAAPSFEATVTSKGQVTIPKEIRERLGVRARGKLRLVVDRMTSFHDAIRAEQCLFGILGKPPRSATIEEMNEGIRKAVAEKYLSSRR